LTTVAYIGLGSNLGDRIGSIVEALRRLNAPGVAVTKVSSIYHSAAILVTDQPDFLNAVAEVHTDLPPRALLDFCLRVESQMGRVRHRRWGPRNIDLDLLLYGDLQIQEPDLQVPHPGLRKRPFVYVPLAEIAPELLLPDGEPVRGLLSSEMVRDVTRVQPPPCWAQDV